MQNDANEMPVPRNCSQPICRPDVSESLIGSFLHASLTLYYTVKTSTSTMFFASVDYNLLHHLALTLQMINQQQLLSVSI